MSELPPIPEPEAPPAPQSLGYASGFHPPEEGGTSIAFRLNAQLIAFNGTTLPQHCILCGTESAGGPIRLTLTWDESFKVTRVSTLELRRQAIVHAYLCVDHRFRWSAARRRGGIGIFCGLLTMTTGITLAALSESSDFPAYTPAGIALMIAGFATIIVALFYFTFGTRTLTCSRIQEGYLYLEGASEKFLSRLPPLQNKNN